MTLLHVLSILATIGAVLYSDEQGLMWILGKKQLLAHTRIEILHVFVSVGISLIILTGGLIVLRAPEYYLANHVFLIKMGFVLVLIVNGFFIGSLSQLATTRTFVSLSLRERLPLLVSGAASVLGWTGALVLGLKLSGWW